VGCRGFRSIYEKGKNKSLDETIEDELRFDIEEVGRNDCCEKSTQEPHVDEIQIEEEEKFMGSNMIQIERVDWHWSNGKRKGKEIEVENGPMYWQQKD
jgi:hypothetical protein